MRAIEKGVAILSGAYILKHRALQEKACPLFKNWLQIIKIKIKNYNNECTKH